jgi:hypothetical protein
VDEALVHGPSGLRPAQGRDLLNELSQVSSFNVRKLHRLRDSRHIRKILRLKSGLKRCQSVRVPVAPSAPIQANDGRGSGIRGRSPCESVRRSLSQDPLDLWARFHRHGLETKGWPAEPEGDPSDRNPDQARSGWCRMRPIKAHRIGNVGPNFAMAYLMAPRPACFLRESRL